LKVIVYDKYGQPEVLHAEEAAKPVPKENEVLVKIFATTVNYGDIAARNFVNLNSKTFNMPLPLLLFAKLNFGLSKPKKRILGNEFAGEIEALGEAVTRYKQGDAVFGYRGQNMGTYAEYVCMPEKGTMAKIPNNITYEEAATVPGGAIVALNVLKK
jgi:NADPH:quinone reductase-like Zn-dependent oxidoreductase